MISCCKKNKTALEFSNEEVGDSPPTPPPMPPLSAGRPSVPVWGLLPRIWLRKKRGVETKDYRTDEASVHNILPVLRSPCSAAKLFSLAADPGQ